MDSLGQPLGMGATPEDYYLVPLSLRLSMPLLSPLDITVFRYKSTSRPRLDASMNQYTGTNRASDSEGSWIL